MGIELLIAAAVISGAFTAFSQIQQAKQQKKVADYNAAIARNSAISAKQWADYNAEREREKQRYRRGKMLVSFLKSGVTLDEGGSADAVLDEQLVQDELDVLAIKREGQARANRFNSQADLSLFEGKEAIRSGYMAATGTILTTGANIATAAYTGGAGKGTTPSTGGTTIT